VNGRSHTGFLAGTAEFREWVTLSNVVSCEIGVASHKGGAVKSHNVKVPSHQSPEGHVNQVDII
jgi:hypothetical protein